MLLICVNICSSWGTGGKCWVESAMFALDGMVELVNLRSVGNSCLPQPGVRVMGCSFRDGVFVGNDIWGGVGVGTDVVGRMGGSEVF